MSEQDVTLDEFVEDEKRQTKREGQSLKSRFWGEIPEGWSLVRPDDVYEVNPNPKPQEEPNTYLEMDALDTTLPCPRYFGERNASEYSGKTFNTGDTLFARITPCTENGKAALVPEMETKVGIGSTEFAVLSPKRGEMIPHYLYYISKSYPVHNYAVSRMRGSTGRQRVPFDVFRRELDIALPPLEEQRKIASVLYTVDEAIQKTEEIIEQKKRIKQGLRQDLLETGVGEHDMIQTDSRFGEIPSNWSLKRLVDVTEIVGRTEPPTDVDKYWGGDIPWAVPEDIRSLDGPVISETEKTVTEAALQEVSSNLVPPGSVLLTTRATVGLCAVNEVELTTSRAFKDLIPSEKIDTWYLYYRIESMEDYLNRLGWGSTFTEVIKPVLENVVIPIPPLEEQKEIGLRLRSLDEALIKSTELKKQYNTLKQGLMQDLISGNTRTTDTAIEVLDEIKQHG